jgi:hypothetical protein
MKGEATASSSDSSLYFPSRLSQANLRYGFAGTAEKDEMESRENCQKSWLLLLLSSVPLSRLTLR